MSAACTYTRPRRAAAMRVDAERDMTEEGVDLEEEPRAPKRPRTSRALHRKTDHSVIERRRREKINDRLICLQSTVPACREKARECIEKKSPNESLRTDDIDARIGTDIVLEKLCIISHTVDYVMELRAKLKAYETQCHCDPKLPIMAERDDGAHCLTTHPEKMQCERSSDASSESPDPKRETPLSDEKHVVPDVCERAELLDDDDVPTAPPHYQHHHDHDMWCRTWRPWIPWHSRACHTHMCYDSPPVAATAAAVAPMPVMPPPYAIAPTRACHYHHHHHQRTRDPWCSAAHRPYRAWGPFTGPPPPSSRKHKAARDDGPIPL